MVVKGFKKNESPPAKLHLFVMQDCFYNEHKSFYNISYGGTESLVRFKEYFNPVEIRKPPYYTFIFQKVALSIFQQASPEKVVKIRAAFKDIRKNIKGLSQKFFCSLFLVQYFLIELQNSIFQQTY
jgi:hypothetical protein